jgi:hypothetical protein
MSQYLHVGFKWKERPEPEKLKSAFDRAIDWVNYSPDCWIIWTSSDPNVWWGRLKPLVEGKGHVFICKIDINVKQGWLPKNIWEWINKER